LRRYQLKAADLGQQDFGDKPRPATSEVAAASSTRLQYVWTIKSCNFTIRYHRAFQRATYVLHREHQLMPNSNDAVADTDPCRKLIVCCDGTWNEPYQEGAPTNVVKMVRAIRPVDAQGVPQIIFYHPGVGTGNWLDRFMGGTMGFGLSANVQSAYDFLASNFVDGDLIFIFGFSRGSFTARSLAGLIGLIGLLEKRDMDLFPRVYDIYRSIKYRHVLTDGSKPKMETALHKLFSKDVAEKILERLIDALLRARQTPIFFIGVWDTVGALGIPFTPLRWIGRSKYQFHDIDLSDKVRYAYHALPIDEARGNFKPTLWNRIKGRGTDKTKRPQTLEQVWFAGVHSNVGGGYPDNGLSDIAFLWMVAKAAAAAQKDNPDSPIAFDEEYLKEKIDQKMGLLVNSRKGIWKAVPSYLRPVMQVPPPDKETCEFIHYSAHARFESKDGNAFAPFPYQPANLKTAIDGHGAIAELTAMEKQYRPWP
jgi:uncharacterized protein (DUF2235 family)